MCVTISFKLFVFFNTLETSCLFVKLLLWMAVIILPVKQQQLVLSLNSQEKSGTIILSIHNQIIMFVTNECRAENGPCGYVVVPVDSERTKLIWIINSNLKVMNIINCSTEPVLLCQLVYLRMKNQITSSFWWCLYFFITLIIIACSRMLSYYSCLWVHMVCCIDLS